VEVAIWLIWVVRTHFLQQLIHDDHTHHSASVSSFETDPTVLYKSAFMFMLCYITYLGLTLTITGSKCLKEDKLPHNGPGSI